MTSAQQHHSRYSLPPPPQNSQNDFRLPSLKDLNFQYRPLPGTAPAPQPTPSAELPAAQQEHPSNSRHVSSWSRSNPPSNPATTSLQSHPHQQHTPPLSAGHEATTKAEYPSKHENGGYVHPGMPLSAHVTPAPGSVNIGTLRNEDAPHSPNQTKRPRTTSTNMGPSRDVRTSHPSYPPPQYASYPPVAQPPATNPYHQIPSGLSGPPSHVVQPAPPPPPPAHEQMHHHPMPVTAHPSYPPQYYMQPRPPVMHQQHSTHPPQPQQSNPYPSPGPPPSAPPPQGPWGQQQQHPPPPQHPSHSHPPPPPPQPPQQHMQQHPSHVQQPHHQQPPAPIPANPSYMVPQHHLQPPPPAPPQQPPQHAPQQQLPHQFQQPPQQIPFARTTAIVPTNIDTRQTYPASEPERMPPRSDMMTEISTQCSILYSFAHRYAQMQNNLLHAQPTETELEEMSQRAQHVVRLLEDLRRISAPETEQSRVPAPEPMQESPDDPRPPKRPWEDVSQDEGPQSEQNSFSECPPVDSNKPQSTAEQDMELIRTKRATTTAGANGPPGQPKSKYRKRSRATPPGKCHSCNIRETPEWRRGPDGARTLCNACGLHYAKLMRKRDKNANGEAPHIDLETLRASARAADIADKASRSSKQASRAHQSEPSSPTEAKQQTPQQHHQGTFQLVNMMAPGSDPSTSTMPSDASRAPPPPTHSSMPPPGSLPPPPWATSAPSTRPVYPTTEHLQHQSFMRSSQHNAPSR